MKIGSPVFNVYVVFEVVDYEGEFIRGIYVSSKQADLRRKELKKELFDLWGDENINGLEIKKMRVGVPLENDHPYTMSSGELHI
tara:strand:- start:2178 stop:2429 length:252 start_codon:yes stop_codon:yes gene_type:complete